MNGSKYSQPPKTPKDNIITVGCNEKQSQNKGDL